MALALKYIKLQKNIIFLKKETISLIKKNLQNTKKIFL